MVAYFYFSPRFYSLDLKEKIIYEFKLPFLKREYQITKVKLINGCVIIGSLGLLTCLKTKTSNAQKNKALE